MQKVLSLCFPTYNRGWCIKEQIKRLQSCPLEIIDKIEILISDNCSTDDTQEIVEHAISQGFVCTYIRNETNLGMDGNFVSCFRKAKGKYVWLLGDDDIILINSLKKIVNQLDNSKEYGLLHLSMTKRLKGEDFIVYDDKDQLCKDISYWFTFISSNIVRAKYVKDVPFEKYMGTWFTLIPLYLLALHREAYNVIGTLQVFEAGKDTKRNGGYNFFTVFVENFQNILYEHMEKGVLSLESFNYIKKDIFETFIRRHIYSLLLKNEKSEYNIDNAWSILFKYYRKEAYFYSGVMKLFIRKFLSD